MSIFDSIGEFFEDVVWRVQEFIEDPIGDIQQTFEDIKDFSSGMKEEFDELKDAGRECIGGIKGDIREEEHRIRKNVEEAVEDIPIVREVVAASNAVHDKVNTLRTTLANPLSPSLGKKVEYTDLKKGDHIFVSRPGYTHHGIYVGNGNVVHYAIDYSGYSCVHETTIEDFKKYASIGDVICETTYVYRFSEIDSIITYSPNEVVNRAYSRVGEAKYDLIFNNCEHFARWCRCGDNY